MGKSKKRYNWKAREQPGGSLETGEISALQKKIDISGVKDKDQFHGSNVLALPAQKQQYKGRYRFRISGAILQ